MTPVDDLSVGMLVAVSEWIGDLPVCACTGRPVKMIYPDCPGKPWKIIALSLPFACLCDADGNRLCLDLRLWALKRVSLAYARACTRAPSANPRQEFFFGRD